MRCWITHFVCLTRLTLDLFSSGSTPKGPLWVLSKFSMAGLTGRGQSPLHSALWYMWASSNAQPAKNLVLCNFVIPEQQLLLVGCWSVTSTTNVKAISSLISCPKEQKHLGQPSQMRSTAMLRKHFCSGVKNGSDLTPRFDFLAFLGQTKFPVSEQPRPPKATPALSLGRHWRRLLCELTGHFG